MIGELIGSVVVWEQSGQPMYWVSEVFSNEYGQNIRICIMGRIEDMGNTDAFILLVQSL